MIHLPNLEATEKLAKSIASLLRPSDVLTLHGDLGSGKTTFARALLRELGIQGEVPSPTFTLVQIYKTARFPVYHFDLYRLKDASELEELGFDDALTSGVTVIEWPERAEGRLTNQRLALHFALGSAMSRTCRLEPYGSWAERLKGMSA